MDTYDIEKAVADIIDQETVTIEVEQDVNHLGVVLTHEPTQKRFALGLGAVHHKYAGRIGDYLKAALANEPGGRVFLNDHHLLKLARHDAIIDLINQK